MDNPDFNSEFSRRAKLHRLGLTELLLAPAISAYRDALAKAGPYHPPGHGGITAYGEATAALAEELVPLGWRSCQKFGFCRVVNPSDTMSIFVSSGDDNTGSEANPSSRYEKGKISRRAVKVNGDLVGYTRPQMLLFSENRQNRASAPLYEGDWCLLFKEVRGDLRVELSLPVACDERGYICEWHERIPLDGGSAELGFEVEASPDVDFDIGLGA